MKPLTRTQPTNLQLYSNQSINQPHPLVWGERGPKVLLPWVPITVDRSLIISIIFRWGVIKNTLSDEWFYEIFNDYYFFFCMWLNLSKSHTENTKLSITESAKHWIIIIHTCFLPNINWVWMSAIFVESTSLQPLVWKLCFLRCHFYELKKNK